MPRTTPHAGRGTTPQRRLATALPMALLAAVLALSGCQTPREDAPGGSPDDPVSSDDSPGSTPSPTQAPPAEPVTADLTIVVDATGDGATQTFTLTCEPAGGDHPDAPAACAALAAAGGADAFAPTPRDVACTEQWGGPQTATVEGTVAGERVSGTFDRTDGCEISRWDRLETVFGPDAGLM